jgi:hypothetical protein
MNRNGYTKLTGRTKSARKVKPVVADEALVSDDRAGVGVDGESRPGQTISLVDDGSSHVVRISLG